MHQTTVPYTPEQNGSSERENRTVVESTRTMLHSMGEEKKFLWAEAVNTAVYVLNRSGTSSVKNKTPIELWSKDKSFFDFKVFGSIVFTHIPKQKRRKFDKKASKYVFVGYGENTKGYRVYNPSKRTIETVRDVIFEKSGLNKENQVCVDIENGDSTASQEQNDFSVENDAKKENIEDINTNSASSSEPTQNNNQVVDSVENNDTNASTVNNNQSVIVIESGESSEIEIESDSDESLHSANDGENTNNNNNFVQNFVNRISGSRICNVDMRNVIASRLRSKAPLDVDFCCTYLASNDESKTYEEAIKSEEKVEWKKAMDEEYESLVKNNTWVLVDTPKNESVIDNRWVFKIKRKPDGTIERYKARLVVRGFTQCYGVNYYETFSPVVTFSSIRAILAISVARYMKLKQFDVKTAFLYGDLSEDVYMKQPIGYDDNSGNVCKLAKSLYGLKQSSRCWNAKFTEFIKGLGFKVCKADPCVFVSKQNGDVTILAIYVDDGLIAIQVSRALHQSSNFYDKVLRSQLQKHIIISVLSLIVNLMARFMSHKRHTRRKSCNDLECKMPTKWLHQSTINSSSG